MHAYDPTDYYLSQIKDLARVKYFTKFDFVCLSETWLKDEIMFITVSVTSWKEAVQNVVHSWQDNVWTAKRYICWFLPYPYHTCDFK